MADIARKAAGRIPLAVASNGECANVKASLRAAGLLHLFHTVVTIEDVRCGKPAPDLYLNAAMRLAVRPSMCLVLEDSDEGLLSARTAGMFIIDVRPYLGTTIRSHEGTP